MSNRNIPINKGNYSSFETRERELLFEKNRADGWEEGYKKYRDSWKQLPLEQIVAEYPLLVDIELASVCNLRCPMCYTITDEFKKKVNTRLMNFSLFTKIIDEISGKVPAIRLSLRGESTLHPRFIECIEYAKSKGIREVSTLTNGSKLDLEFFKKMACAGIDWITISVDGLDEEYEKIRKPLKFSATYRRISDIASYKKENNLRKPVIKIQSLWPAIKQNPTKFYKTFESITDLIAFNPLIDYLQNDSDIVYIDNFSCPQLYQRVVIGSDGKVMMCSNDEEGSFIVGDANSQTIYDIWHGDALNKVRDTHKKQDGFKKIEVCKKCYLPRATEASEVSEVDGRKFEILNYINRSQEIGK